MFFTQLMIEGKEVRLLLEPFGTVLRSGFFDMYIWNLGYYLASSITYTNRNYSFFRWSCVCKSNFERRKSRCKTRKVGYCCSRAIEKKYRVVNFRVLISHYFIKLPCMYESYTEKNRSFPTFSGYILSYLLH